jgi:hypothetical protein
MNMLHALFLLFAGLSLHLYAQEESNVLIYTDPVQISSSINAYENLTAGQPIQGSVMVTHQENNAVDADSFKLGDKPLKVELVQSTPMSSYSHLVVTIYSFQFPGMSQGMYTLDPINVKVGGKVYQAPPLTIQVP